MFGRSYLLLCFAAALAGCGDEATAPGDVIFESGATDEAWFTVDDAPPVVDDAAAPRLTAPVSPVPRAAPARFEWNGGAVAAAASIGSPQRPRRDVLDVIARELFPVARAHEPPVTGPIYRLTIGLGAGAAPVRVLTGATSYTPSADIWSRISGAAGPLEIEISGSYLQTGRLEEGPYVASTPAVLELE